MMSFANIADLVPNLVPRKKRTVEISTVLDVYRLFKLNFLLFEQAQRQ